MSPHTRPWPVRSEYNTGFNMITGKCGGGDFFLGVGASKRCEEMLIAVRFSSAEFTIGDWTAVVRGNWVYDRISGPAHRLDLSLRARGGVAARHLPHGIIGQAFASAEPRHGRVDEYPASGTFTTSAMAEGAIDGNAAMYELAGPHATAFAFSRFEAAEVSAVARGALAADADAASTDGAVESSHLSSRRRLSESSAPCSPPPSPSPPPPSPPPPLVYGIEEAPPSPPPSVSPSPASTLAPTYAPTPAPTPAPTRASTYGPSNGTCVCWCTNGDCIADLDRYKQLGDCPNCGTAG